MFRGYVLAFALVMLVMVALVMNWVRAGDSGSNQSCIVGVYNKVIEGIPVRDVFTGDVVSVNVNVTVRVFVEGISSKVEAAVLVEPAEPGNVTISYSMPFMDMVVETSEGKAYRWSEGKAFIMLVISKSLPMKESVSMVVNSSCITGIIVYVKPLGLKIEFGNVKGFEPTLTQTSVKPMLPSPEKRNASRFLAVIKDWPKPGNLTLLVIPVDAEAETVPYGEGVLYNYTIACPPGFMELLRSVANGTATIAISANGNYTLHYSGNLLPIIISLCTSRNITYYVINEKDLASTINELINGGMTVIFTYATPDLGIYGEGATNNVLGSTTAPAPVATTTYTPAISQTENSAETTTTWESSSMQSEGTAEHLNNEETATTVPISRGVRVMPVSYTALLLGIVAALLVGFGAFVLFKKF